MSTEIRIENYILKEKIGEGGFATVYKGYKIWDDQNIIQYYAIKKIDQSAKKIGTEVETLANEKLKVSDDKTENLGICQEIIEDRIKCEKYFILKLYNGGDLKQYIQNQKNKPLKIEEIIHIMKNILNGLTVLHKNLIFHSDIKPANLMVNYDNKEDLIKKNLLKSKIVIIDLGCASMHINNEKTESNFIKGTKLYMHPKLIESNNNLKEEKDIWSLGLVCLELFTGDLNKHYDRENGIYKIPLNENTSVELVRFIDKMLQYESNNQANLEQLMNEPFLINPSLNLFKKEYAGDKLEIIENKSFLKLNYKSGYNFDYDKLDKLLKNKRDEDEELNGLINKLFIELNENFLFTEPVLIPVIPK